MILNSQVVEQVIDGGERGRFVKELVVVRRPIPIAMIRKRAATSNGTRATLLLIHGYGQNRYAWHLPGRSFANHLAAQGFDVYSMDLRGHGKSGHFGSRRPISPSDHVREDVPTAVEEIQRISGSAPIWLVGHSLGGLISYAAASSMQDAVAGIATFGSPYHFTRGSWALAQLGALLLLIDGRVQQQRGWLPLYLWGEGMRVLQGFVESPAFPLPFRGFAPRSMEAEIYAQHMALAMDRASIEVMTQMFRTVSERRKRRCEDGGLAGFEGGFEGLDLPLLVVAGNKDDLAPPSAVKPAYQRSLSRDKSYRVFEAGHIDLLVGKSAPHTTWAALDAWLSGRVGG